MKNGIEKKYIRAQDGLFSAYETYQESSLNSAWDQRSQKRQPNSEARAKACEVLGLEPHATEDQIKKAFIKRLFFLHPDQNLPSSKEIRQQNEDEYKVISNLRDMYNGK